MKKTEKGETMKNIEETNQFGKELSPKSENRVIVKITDDVIEAIAAIGELVALWVKIVETGFLANDKIISEICGRIIRIILYGVKWSDKKPDKIPFDPGKDLPEGYEPRCDLLVEVSGQVIGLSLSKSSLKYHLSPYIRNLINKQLRPEDVITRLRVKQASNKFGSFNVVIFDAVDKATEPTLVTPPPVVVVNEPPVSTPPQPQGSTTQTAEPSNPWA